MAINLSSNELPEQWVVSKLPEFTHVVMGQSPSSETYNYDGIGWPFFQGKAEFGEVHPTINKYCSLPNKVANEGATLLSVRAPVGPTNLANTRCCIGRGLAAIHPMGEMEPKFIFLLFRSIELNLSGEGTGSTFSAITKAYVDDLKFAIPPLNEQNRIVAKIEELFSELDNGISALKTAREQLKVYRQAVLKHAFEGKLTAKWREENADKLESPEQLLARIQQEREARYQQQLEEWKAAVKKWEEQGKEGKKPKKPRPLDISVSDESTPEFKLPSGWIWCKVRNLISDLTDYHANGSYEVLKENVELKDEPDYALMVRATNFEKNNFESDQKYISKSAYDFLSKSKLFGGEILVGKIGNAGKVYFMPYLNRPTSLAMNLFCLRFEGLHSNFIYNQLMSARASEQIKSYVKGVGNPTIDKKALRSIDIAVPCEAEQEYLIEKIENILSQIEHVESEIQTNLDKSENLRQSILKKAFSGQLVPQDPNDEPASVLLERIQVEKTKDLNPPRSPFAKGGGKKRGQKPKASANG